jgi:hypothetical protein
MIKKSFSTIGEESFFEQMRGRFLSDLNSEYMKFHGGIDFPLDLVKRKQESEESEKKELTGVKDEMFLDESLF